jgi:hypothetical protein
MLLFIVLLRWHATSLCNSEDKSQAVLCSTLEIWCMDTGGMLLHNHDVKTDGVHLRVKVHGTKCMQQQEDIHSDTEFLCIYSASKELIHFVVIVNVYFTDLCWNGFIVISLPFLPLTRSFWSNESSQYCPFFFVLVCLQPRNWFVGVSPSSQCVWDIWEVIFIGFLLCRMRFVFFLSQRWLENIGVFPFQSRSSESYIKNIKNERRTVKIGKQHGRNEEILRRNT